VQDLTNLTIATTVENNCQPKARLCDDIQAEDFHVRIYEFQDGKPQSLTMLPGSSQGWTITFPQSIQYDVNQFLNSSLGNNIAVGLNYSNDCHRYLSVREAFCRINAELTTTMVGAVQLGLSAVRIVLLILGEISVPITKFFTTSYLLLYCYQCQSL
jgi:hypothetical protein